MTNLNFSEAIELSYNQRASVVIDWNKNGPKIGNYGLILETQGNENTPSTFKIQMVAKDLNENRNFNILAAGDKEAKNELNSVCASNLNGLEGSDLFNFVVKTFPHYGVYGYVNYKQGDAATYRSGVLLETARGGSDIYDETN
jgi:hypothetical protein